MALFFEQKRLFEEKKRLFKEEWLHMRSSLKRRESFCSI
jgi:hypothetical protein